jgi:hypothetical protein
MESSRSTTELFWLLGVRPLVTQKSTAALRITWD